MQNLQQMIFFHPVNRAGKGFLRGVHRFIPQQIPCFADIRTHVGIEVPPPADSRADFLLLLVPGYIGNGNLYTVDIAHSLYELGGCQGVSGTAVKNLTGCRGPVMDR